MKVSLVIPYIVENREQEAIVSRCVDRANELIGKRDTEIVLIDNGSPVKQLFADYKTVRNKTNTGVLATFRQGLEVAEGEVICFIHSDVLLHETDWDGRISRAFADDEKLGLAGLFGARGVGDNGGRIESMSNMQGHEWGKCNCHAIAWQHHSAHLTGVAPATILDAVGMFFRREALTQLVTETDAFDAWRAPHHFMDRFLPLKLIDLGWHIATIGIEFDHFSGATANASQEWRKLASVWLKAQGHASKSTEPDHDVYRIAEQQFFAEFGHRIPALVDDAYNYSWRAS